MNRLTTYVLVAAGCGVALASDIPPPRPALSAAEVEQMLARGKKFAERGEIDLFVAATAAWKLKAEDDRLWSPAQAVGRVAVEKAIAHEECLPRGPVAARDFAEYRSTLHPRFDRTDGVYRRPVIDVQLAHDRVMPGVKPYGVN